MKYGMTCNPYHASSVRPDASGHIFTFAGRSSTPSLHPSLISPFGYSVCPERGRTPPRRSWTHCCCCCYRCCSHWRKTKTTTPQATAATSWKSTSSKNWQFVQRLTYDLIRAGLCTVPCRFSVRLLRAGFRYLRCPSSISGCPFRYRTAPAPLQAGKSCSEAQRWRVGNSRA